MADPEGSTSKANDTAEVPASQSTSALCRHPRHQPARRADDAADGAAASARSHHRSDRDAPERDANAAAGDSDDNDDDGGGNGCGYGAGSGDADGRETTTTMMMTTTTKKKRKKRRHGRSHSTAAASDDDGGGAATTSCSASSASSESDGGGRGGGDSPEFYSQTHSIVLISTSRSTPKTTPKSTVSGDRESVELSTFAAAAAAAAVAGSAANSSFNDAASRKSEGGEKGGGGGFFRRAKAKVTPAEEPFDEAESYDLSDASTHEIKARASEHSDSAALLQQRVTMQQLRKAMGCDEDYSRHPPPQQHRLCDVVKTIGSPELGHSISPSAVVQIAALQPTKLPAKRVITSVGRAHLSVWLNTKLGRIFAANLLDSATTETAKLLASRCTGMDHQTDNDTVSEKLNTLEFEGIVLASRYLKRTWSRLLDTPRVPDQEELDSYEWFYYNDTNTTLYNNKYRPGHSHTCFCNPDVTQQEIEEYAWRTGGIDSILGDIQYAFPAIRLLYYSGANTFVRTFPWLPDECHNYTDWSLLPWFYLADPQHNPENKTVFTNLYQDPYTLEWMISCLTPIYRVKNNVTVFDGVLGLDIITTAILDALNHISLPWNGHLMLIGEDGTIIAANSNSTNEWDIYKLYASLGEFVNINDLNDTLSKEIASAIVNDRGFFWSSTGILVSWYTLTSSMKLVMLLEDAPTAGFKRNAITYSIITGVCGVSALSISLIVLGTYLFIQISHVTKTIISPLENIEGAAVSLGAGNFDVFIPPHPIIELNHTGDVIMHISRKLENTIEKIRMVSKASEAFIPKKIVDLLGKRELTQLMLNDCCRWQEMSVLFLHIDNILAVAEQLPHTSLFQLLNSFFGQVIPEIIKYKGFVDKYLGGSIIVLFPYSPEDAVGCCVTLTLTIQEFNAARGTMPELVVGMGVATGPIIIGTVGVEHRLDVNAVGETSEIAMKLALSTRLFGSSPQCVYALALGTSLTKCPHYLRSTSRLVGSISMRSQRGKVLEVFELVSPSDPHRSSKLQNAKILEGAIHHFSQRRIGDCVHTLEQLPCHQSGDDAVAELYIQKTNTYLQQGGPPPPTPQATGPTANHTSHLKYCELCLFDKLDV